ncbi:MAG: hypothetical protein WCX73_01350 [Candidatus Pacearchaeota archaeon]|jgi:hypothetical protein
MPDSSYMSNSEYETYKQRDLDKDKKDEEDEEKVLDDEDKEG